MPIDAYVKEAKIDSIEKIVDYVFPLASIQVMEIFSGSQIMSSAPIFI